ncbi:MAG: hypothetical protein KJP00_10135 [Bacteroidia bacterium]|nr:hypothetical protein [Bacteroidia bacterium]
MSSQDESKASSKDIKNHINPNARTASDIVQRLRVQGLVKKQPNKGHL